MLKRPLNQKLIGVLGGSSNVATELYYKFLNETANRLHGGWDIAETMIAGMNFGNIEAFLRTDDWGGLENYMAPKIDGLIASGIDVLICVSNTLHKPAQNLLKTRSVPFIHIADPTGHAIRHAGLSRIALFGTKQVMSQKYQRERYEVNHALEVSVPTPAEQDDINRIIFDELVRHEIRPDSKARYLEIAHRLVREEKVEGLILGCTEIPLLIDQTDCPDLPVFNTTRLHCEAAVDFALSSPPSGTN